MEVGGREGDGGRGGRKNREEIVTMWREENRRWHKQVMTNR